MKPKADYRPLIEKWQDVVIELHNKRGQMFPGGEGHSPFDFFEAGYQLRERELNQKLEECSSKYLDQSLKYQDALDALLGVRDSLREAVEVIRFYGSPSSWANNQMDWVKKQNETPANNFLCCDYYNDGETLGDLGYDGKLVNGKKAREFLNKLENKE